MKYCLALMLCSFVSSSYLFDLDREISNQNFQDEIYQEDTEFYYEEPYDYTEIDEEDYIYYLDDSYDYAD